MGVSTDVILFYGYCWSKDGVELWPNMERGEGRREDKEWQKLVLEARGMKDPWDDYPAAHMEEVQRTKGYEAQRAEGEKWAEEHRAELDAWYAARRAVEEEFGVEVGWHCSCECPLPYAYVVASRLVAHRGCPKAVDPAALGLVGDQTGPQYALWGAMLDRWAEALGVQKPDGQECPRWWLVSHWC